ncbi:MAG: hypothetical protein JO159_18655 [Acidobacteria bacterium]|nr:hypothetical protein [Acidobacteriota bacterium]
MILPRANRYRASERVSILFLLIFVVGLDTTLRSDSVAVRHREGVSRGFLLLSSLDGKILAVGDMIQAVKDEQVTSETVFHFKDGSVHDETTVFSQDHTFRLLSDHLVENGPSFPHPIDIFIETSKNEVTIHASDKGKQTNATEHMDLPADLSNGLTLTLLRNILPSTPESTVSMLAMSSKPRLIKLSIRPRGERAFSVGGSRRRATDYDVKVEIGGIASAVAPIVGKQPPDTHIWMSAGAIPTFVRWEGPLYEGGPIWRADLASPKVADRDLNTDAASK